MTWIGKILSVFVLILGIAAMWFIATVFVARTNWKNDRDAWPPGVLIRAPPGSTSGCAKPIF